jgi:hypothetical protein|tara:strand:- start:112 stop:303 length:192 start_codon:yes stop_codon:yes gene_type:complete
MLDHWQHATGQQTLGGGAAQLRDIFDISGERAVTDNGTCAGELHIENWQAANIDPDMAEVRGD